MTNGSVLTPHPPPSTPHLTPIFDAIFSIAFLSKYSGHQWLKCHPLICMTHRRLQFYFDPEKLWHPIIQTPYISLNLLAKHSSLTFPLCFYYIVGICGTFWHNLASSNPMSAISLCMGCCQVVCVCRSTFVVKSTWGNHQFKPIKFAPYLSFNAQHEYVRHLIGWM